MDCDCTIDERNMMVALKLAEQAAALGEVPVGAVIFKGDKIVSAAYNRRELDANALAHAELLAIDIACKKLGRWRLEGCTLYVTLEPCPMCAGAIINSRIPRAVYGADDPKSGAMGSVTALQELPLNHKVTVVGGVLEEKCSLLLRTFFKKLRSKREKST